MKVFVFEDDNGVVGVYDVDSYNQSQSIFRKVILDLCGDPEEIKGMDIEDIMMYMQEQLGITFNNWGGKFHKSNRMVTPRPSRSQRVYYSK